MLGQMIEIEGGEAYLSPSVTGTGPGVLVVQEWWGLNDHIKEVADRFAEVGFTALAPDLYGGVSTTEPDEAGSLMQALNIAATNTTFQAATRTLLAHPQTVPNDRAGVVGFCMGGQLALYAAGTNPQIRAVVDFYGVHPRVHPVFANFNGPVLGLFAEFDSPTTQAAIKEMEQELIRLGKPHEFITYPGTRHAFFNNTRPAFDPTAAEDAWQRTVQFFVTNLR